MIGQISPADEADIIERVQKALNEYERRRELQRELESTRTKLQATVDQATTARAEADTSIFLAPPEERAQWTAKAEEEAKRLDSARVELDRVTGVLAKMPAFLQSATEAIVEAAVFFEPLRLARHAAARVQLSDALKQQLPALRQIVEHAQALAMAGVPIGTLLNELKIPDPANNPIMPLLTGTAVRVDGEVVAIRDTWQSNPQAMQAHDAHAPLLRLANRLNPHLLRAEAEKDAALMAQNNAARGQAFRGAPPSSSAKPAADVASPKATYVPQSWDFNPQQIMHDGQVKVDIGNQDPAPMTQGQANALWAKAGGQAAAPAEHHQASSDETAYRAPPRPTVRVPAAGSHVVNDQEGTPSHHTGQPSLLEAANPEEA